MKTPRKPAFRPDDSSHPLYALALKHACAIVNDASTGINPFAPPPKFKRSNFTPNKPGQPYPRPLFAWNGWPRKSNASYTWEIDAPEWCPLPSAQRRDRIVILQAIEATELGQIYSGEPRVVEGIPHDCCFVFDPAEIALVAGLDPAAEAARQQQREDRTAREEAEREQRLREWQMRSEEQGRLASEAARIRAEEAERKRRMQPSLFSLGKTDVA